jgi:spore germination protein YaaH
MSQHRIRIALLALLVAGATALPVSASNSAPPATVKDLAIQSAPRIMDQAAGAAALPGPKGLQPFGKTIPLNIAAAANSRLRREVFGFVNASNLGDPSVGYTTWNLSLLSTVAYFSIHVNAGNGNLVYYDTGWNIFHSATMSNFINAAHAAGVKVIVSINLHDFSTDPNNQVCQGLAPTSTQNTIAQTVALVSTSGIDGINVNYEATLTTCANGASNRDELSAFMMNLRAAMPIGSYLAIDTFSGAAEDNLEFFNLTALAPYVDSFFVMAYDMDAANATEVPLSCSSYCFSPMSPLNTYRFNVTKSMAQYTALVPASKVILGQPLYGRTGCVPNLTDPHQYPSPYVPLVAPTYINASVVSSQPDTFTFTAHRDPGDGVSRWDTWYDKTSSCNREQIFDDTQSLGAKYDVVNANNLRGVGFFTLDYGAGAPELWNEIDLKFGATTPWFSLGGGLTSGPDASSWGSTRTDVFARGGDNALWHRSWNGTAWTDWESLGGVLTEDPTAVSWGPNRIDVLVRGSGNAIWHRSSDGTTWSAWESLGGVATSGPEVTSWGVNRLDVFVAGGGNALWQRVFDGTNWGTWNLLGGVLTSDPGAISAAPNTVDVFVRGTDHALWHDSWNGTSWTWSSLGGIITSGPDAASCTAGHLDVYATGSDSGLWQRGFNGTTWSDWQSLRGQWSSRPAAVCPTGTTAISLFERGPDAQLWQTSVPAT